MYVCVGLYMIKHVGGVKSRVSFHDMSFYECTRMCVCVCVWFCWLAASNELITRQNMQQGSECAFCRPGLW